MGIPVVFIHGMWSTGSTLNPIRAAFEGWGYTCHSPTLPFHDNGGNAEKVATISHRDYVEYLKAHINKLGLTEPPILVGHSMGGLLTQLVAAQIPTRALVLFAPAAPAGINAINANSLKSMSHALFKWKFWEKAHKHPTLEAASFALFNNLPAQRQQELFNQLVPESGRAVFEAGFAALDSSKATQVNFANITAPVLILHGTDDRIVIVEGSRQVVGKYANATLKEYAGSGHWMFEETVSEKIFEDVRGWLKAQKIETGA